MVVVHLEIEEKPKHVPSFSPSSFMYLITRSVLCWNHNNLVLLFTNKNNNNSMPPFAFSTAFHQRRRRRRHLLLLVVVRAKKKRPWWHNFFRDDDDQIWSGWRADDVLEDAINGNGEEEEEPSESEKFESWKRRADAISELRDAQEDARNAEGRQWEDWLPEPSSNTTTRSSSNDDSYGLMGDNDFGGSSITNSVTQEDDADDELLFEDRVFRYAYTSSAKFVATLVLIPWVLDFLVHDYVLMPFLDRYVKTVPLAAEMLDVRRHQKLEMIKALRVEKGRFQLEVEIGKSPPLSNEEAWLELRQKALELRDEWRLENRRTFANIWSDMIYGIVLFILIYSNKSKVALLKFTGYKLLNNISDTGKAFLIILITDIFLGYHSESGWQALVEIILEHYGIEVDPAAITIFICSVPVVIDACVKLWLFKYLPRLSPNVANIFDEMKRH